MRGLEEMMEHQRLHSVRKCRFPGNWDRAAISVHHLSSTLFCDAQQEICLKSSVPAQSLSQGTDNSMDHSSQFVYDPHSNMERMALVESWRHRAEAAFYVIKEGGSARQ
jgi:hypothetical protein